MKLDDPQRPKINGFPAICDQQGKPSQPFHGFTVVPRGSEGIQCVRVLFMAKREANSYSWMHVDLPADTLPEFLTDFNSDPEDTLEAYMIYIVPTVAQPASVPELTLADLGL